MNADMRDPSPSPAYRPTVAEVAGILRPHANLYRVVPPVYQTQLLASLAEVWDPRHRSLLDIGGGTGILAEAMRLVFKLDRVVSVDVEDRFAPGLGIAVATFDGRTLPFADASFDAVVLNNVLHHVARADRIPLLRECRRVSRNPVYIKDHLARGMLDRFRLALLDIMGNVPFAGMLRASYLTRSDWQDLAAALGLTIVAENTGRYRSGLFSQLFPNRLEVTIRWMPRPT
ncbi:class I SAM-dependent methyltransferase [Methylobacterium sp. WL12]|uniref:class I SAM-dependent methyltransferase n=1 Tax=Methylobacterium sp. WL12 TaxID=2603890 RepID=UPI0011CBFB21|nr:class I SAM-dependent methyltransferase [Methylobacterium sp. WL12]TXM65142.1 class I SAM-dependent methyltransferase [Methylobacterium sp. WL12]